MLRMQKVLALLFCIGVSAVLSNNLDIDTQIEDAIDVEGEGILSRGIAKAARNIDRF